MQGDLVRSAVFAVAALVAVPAGAEEPVELLPGGSIGRVGRMDENGTVARPTTAREIAAGMVVFCDYVVLGRFVSVTDRRYHESSGGVVSTFEVSEVLRGKPVAVATIRLQKYMLVAPGKDVSRYLSSVEIGADEMYRYELATEMERELASIRDSGRPLTPGQHERLVDGLKRLVKVPRRTRYEQHELAGAWIATNSPLTFFDELGAIRPDELYLLGLQDKDSELSTGFDHFNNLHTYLFWGREALDIAAALREKQE